MFYSLVVSELKYACAIRSNEIMVSIIGVNSNADRIDGRCSYLRTYLTIGNALPRITVEYIYFGISKELTCPSTSDSGVYFVVGCVQEICKITIRAMHCKVVITIVGQTYYL